MKLTKTSLYTSSSADNRGFQQKPEISGNEDAIEFKNGLVMTISACLAYLVNNQLISWAEKKSIQAKNATDKFLKISQFENHFLSL